MVACNVGFLKTPIGILRLLEIVFTFVITFLAGTFSGCVTKVYDPLRDEVINKGYDCGSGYLFPFPWGFGWTWGPAILTGFCAVIFFVCLILFVAHCFSTSSVLVLIEIAWIVICIIALAIGWIWISITSTTYRTYWSNYYGQIVAAAVLAAVCWIFFIIDLALTLKDRKGTTRTTTVNA